MTTSGTANFNENLNQIIYASARKIGAISFGEVLSSSTIQAFSDQLNVFVKALNATGLHIWTEEEAILFLQPGQYSYTLGGATTDNCAWTTYSATTLLASAGSGATTISVASTTGFGASFFVGVVLNSGAISWAQESGAPSGSNITLGTALSGAANAGNAVYVYPTQVQRPLRVVSGRRFAFNGQIDTPMIMMSRVDYRNQPNKTNLGVITQFFYDPRGGANNQGVLWTWPAPQDVTSALKFTWWRQIQDFTAPGNTPDLPDEWLDALTWNLAYKMAPEFGCPAARYQMIQQQAAESLDLVSGWDREPESYLFGYSADQTSGGAAIS